MRAFKRLALAGLFALGAFAPALGDVPTSPFSDRNTIAACTAACDVPLKTTGQGTVNVSATGSGGGLTFSVQGLQADGATWVTLPAYNEGTQTSTLSALSANGSWIVSSGGYEQVRVHLTAISSGTENIALNGAVGAHALVITAMPGISITNPTVGAAVPATANYVAGNKSGNLVGVTLDGSSNLNVDCATGCGSTSDASFSGGPQSATGIIVASTDGTGFNSLSFAFGVGGSATLKVQESNDNVTFFDVPITNTTTGGVAPTNGITPVTATTFTAPMLMRYVRLNVTAWVSGALTVQGSLKGGVYPNNITLGTGANVIGALSANQSVNHAQVSGTAVSVNNGTTDAGTQRVTLSSDSTGQVKLATGANTIGALTANQSTNVAQVAGTTADTNSGTKSAGTLRVVIATDQPALTNKLLVTPDSVALPANQSVNAAQINGVTPLMGNGTTGTGSPRVTIASDNSTLTNTFGNVGEVPLTAGGLSTFVLEPAASDNHTNIKNGAGQVYGILAFNNSATVNYWRLYNAASGFNGCNSATNLVLEGHIPASTSDAGFVIPIPGGGVAFGTGISICVTSAYGQTAVTNATALAISLDILYK